MNTALTNYEQEHATLDALNEDVKQAQIALNLAEGQYTQGLTDYLFVLNAQQALLSAQVNQAQSTARMGTDLVTLYQALGGGWGARTHRGEVRRARARGKQFGGRGPRIREGRQWHGGVPPGLLRRQAEQQQCGIGGPPPAAPASSRL